MLKSLSLSRTMCITEKQQYVKQCTDLCGNGSCVNVSLHSVSTRTQRDEHASRSDGRGCRRRDAREPEINLWTYVNASVSGRFNGSRAGGILVEQTDLSRKQIHK